MRINRFNGNQIETDEVNSSFKFQIELKCFKNGRNMQIQSKQIKVILIYILI